MIQKIYIFNLPRINTVKCITISAYNVRSTLPPPPSPPPSPPPPPAPYALGLKFSTGFLDMACASAKTVIQLISIQDLSSYIYRKLTEK